MQTKILILAGGSGTRLWPVSRELMPKQLLSLIQDRSLLQETCRRILPLNEAQELVLMTNAEQVEQVHQQMEQLFMDDIQSHYRNRYQVRTEPCSKNTAPPIFWEAQRIMKQYGPDSLMIVLPADHMVIREQALLDALRTALHRASDERLVIFGIQPTHPETGYGYLKVDLQAGGASPKVLPVRKFVEKPDEKNASRYLEEGDYLWNSGMFVFHVGTLLSEGRKHCPEVALPFAATDPEDENAVENVFAGIASGSIDKMLMEKSKRVDAISLDIGWSDMGSWKNYYDYAEKDQQGNVVRGDTLCLDTTESLVYSESRLVATIGIQRLAVVDTPDALLVSSLDQTQRVRETVQMLKLTKASQLVAPATVVRKWGTYTVLQQGAGYKVKKIIVNPQASLSLQLHHHRSEHWVVVSGVADVINGHKTLRIHENESTFIPAGTRHQLLNPTAQPLEIIEVQTGDYLEEDDILRFKSHESQSGVDS